MHKREQRKASTWRINLDSERKWKHRPPLYQHFSFETHYYHIYLLGNILDTKQWEKEIELHNR